jgi:hypothetical protein
MHKKEKKEEQELINYIRNYRELFRESIKEKLLKDREEKHKKGEVFLQGFWGSRDKIENIQKYLLKRGRVVFIEIHIIFFIFASFIFFLWILFKRFFLP